MMARLGVIVSGLGFGILLHAGGVFPQAAASPVSPMEWPIGILMLVAGIGTVLYADRRKT